MRACILLLCGLSLAAGARGGLENEVTVRWKSQRLTVHEVGSSQMPGFARDAVARVAAHADLADLRVDVSKDGRIVLGSDASERTVRGAEVVVREALEAFDALFPLPEPAGEDAPEPRAVTILRSGPLPEPSGHSGRDGTWRSDDGAVWHLPSTTNRRQAEGQLARTIARALLRDRFGDLPGWFTRGVELNVEALATRRLASEDDGASPRAWRLALRREWSDRDETLPLDLGALGWRSEEDPEYVPGDAPTVWGLVAELATRAEGEGLAGLADELSERFEAPSRAPGGGAGPDAQRRLLERHAGRGALDALEGALATGKVALKLR